jgi:hypothetical protein
VLLLLCQLLSQLQQVEVAVLLSSATQRGGVRGGQPECVAQSAALGRQHRAAAEQNR